MQGGVQVGAGRWVQVDCRVNTKALLRRVWGWAALSWDAQSCTPSTSCSAWVVQSGWMDCRVNNKAGYSSTAVGGRRERPSQAALGDTPQPSPPPTSPPRRRRRHPRPRSARTQHRLAAGRPTFSFAPSTSTGRQARAGGQRANRSSAFFSVHAFSHTTWVVSAVIPLSTRAPCAVTRSCSGARGGGCGMGGPGGGSFGPRRAQIPLAPLHKRSWWRWRGSRGFRVWGLGLVALEAPPTWRGLTQAGPASLEGPPSSPWEDSPEHPDACVRVCVGGGWERQAVGTCLHGARELRPDHDPGPGEEALLLLLPLSLLPCCPCRPPARRRSRRRCCCGWGRRLRALALGPPPAAGGRGALSGAEPDPEVQLASERGEVDCLSLSEHGAAVLGQLLWRLTCHCCCCCCCCRRSCRRSCSCRCSCCCCSRGGRWRCSSSSGGAAADDVHRGEGSEADGAPAVRRALHLAAAMAAADLLHEALLAHRVAATDGEVAPLREGHVLALGKQRTEQHALELG